MRVKRLEINGFKSFADRTVLDFSSAMCSVVGPNGCGKSNVVDAVRWVLGEQSARQLRGQAMEDVLFNGASGRKPSGLAEVSIVFDNDGGMSSGQFSGLSEITVTRRLYRSGESEYLINKVGCRLKDIQQLLMDTGLGNRAYAIIEQGKVASFIEARPEERRLWVEEAAGITRYKSQKKVSLKKLEGARENLDRLNDILLEVETQMKRLESQAEKARKHQELREKVRELDLTVSCFEYKELSGLLDQAGSLSDSLGAQADVASDRVAALEADLETAKLALLKAEEDINLSGQSRLKAQGDIQKSENELSLLGRQAEDSRRQAERLKGELARTAERSAEAVRDLERARKAAVADLEKAELAREEARRAARSVEEKAESAKVLEREADAARTRLVDQMSRATQDKNRRTDLERRRGELSRRREQVETRRAALSGELARIGEDKRGLAARVEEDRTELSDLVGEWDELTGEMRLVSSQAADLRGEAEDARRRVVELEARVEALGSSLSSGQWTSDGVRRVVEAAREGGLPVEILGLMAENLDVRPGWEALAETALGPDLQAVLVPGPEEARELAVWAAENGAGRIRIVDAGSLAPGRLAPPQGPGLTPLADIVTPRPGLEALAALWEGAAAALEAAPAWEALKNLRPGQVLAGPDGFLADKPGAVSVGEGGGGGLLAAKNQLMALEDELAEARDEKDEVSRRLSALESRLAEVEEERRTLASRRDELDRAIHQGQREVTRLVETAGLKAQQLEGLDFDGGEMDDELSALEREEEDLAVRLEGHEALRRELEDALAASREELEAGREELEEARRAEGEARVSAAGLEQRAEQAGRDAKRLAAEALSAGERAEALEAELDSLEEQRTGLIRRKEEEQVRLGRLYEEMDRREKAYSQALEEHGRLMSGVSGLDKELKEARSVLKRLEDEFGQAGWKLKELNLRRDQLAEQVLERCHLDLSQGCQEHLPRGAFDLEEGRDQLERYRKRLTNLGPVNLEAIQEHRALAERHKFLTDQKTDLEDSLEDLKKAIRKINRTSRERFLATLEEVNNRLASVFPVLFGGGEARLVLEENLDPLDAGLFLLVEPPGKKVRNLEALSGGEKALSAVAVLFSLFLIRPAPFCILDEVDAPLDEANTGRFLDLVKELSDRCQILAITHSRRTMEIMDVLYGVTMEEKGVSKLLSVTLTQGESLAA